MSFMTILLQQSAKCKACGTEIPSGTKAIWGDPKGPKGLYLYHEDCCSQDMDQESDTDKPKWQKDGAGTILTVGYDKETMSSIIICVNRGRSNPPTWGWQVKARDGLGRCVLRLGSNDEPDATGDVNVYTSAEEAGKEGVKFVRKFLIKALADLPD